MLHRLEQTHYTRLDAAARRDPVAFLHEILRLTRHDNRPEHKRLTIGYIHFESQLRMSLIAPRYDTGISEFIEQLEGKKHAWYETYQYFGKRKDYFLSEHTPNQQGNKQRPPPKRFPPRHNTAPPPHNSAPPHKQLQGPQGPNAYFIDPQEQAYYAKHGGTPPRGYPEAEEERIMKEGYWGEYAEDDEHG